MKSANFSRGVRHKLIVMTSFPFYQFINYPFNHSFEKIIFLF